MAGKRKPSSKNGPQTNITDGPLQGVKTTPSHFCHAAPRRREAVSVPHVPITPTQQTGCLQPNRALPLGRSSLNALSNSRSF